MVPLSRPDGAASVSARDAAGKERLGLTLAAAGAPSVAFYDAEGGLIQRLAPAP